jgi:uncharacterized membrane protein
MLRFVEFDFLKGALVLILMVSHVIRNLHLKATWTEDLSFFMLKAKASKK